MDTTNVLEWGVAGGFAVLVLGVLTRVLKDASTERQMWLEQMKAEGQENRAALSRLSEVLIEMRVMLQSQNGGK